MNISTATPVIPDSATDRAVARARLNGTVWGALGSLPAAVYQRSLRLGRWLARVGVSANALTVASLAISIGAGVAVGFGYPLIGALLIVLAGACDMLDGIVARASGTTSPFGALLDSTVDRVSDAAPLVGLMAFHAGGPGAVPAIVIASTAIVASFTISYVRARVESLGAMLPALFMRRPERVALVVISLVLARVPIPVAIPAPLTLAGVAFLAVLALVGAAVAVNSARRALESAR